MNVRSSVETACIAGEAAITSVPASFESNGVRIHYVDQGKGAPVLLLHGQNGSTEIAWGTAGVIADLARDYRVIGFDMRGLGNSGKPHEPSAYGREMGLDAIRLLDHLGIEKAHFVGYSFGGFLTAQLVTTHPERFLSATFVGAGPRLRYTEADRASDELEATEREKECFSRSFFSRLSPPGSPVPSEEAFRQMIDECKANASIDQFALAAVVRTKGAQLVTEASFASVNVPMLGIAGGLDPNMRVVREAQRLQPDMKVVCIEGATHFGPKRAQSRPEFIKALREFLAAQ